MDVCPSQKSDAKGKDTASKVALSKPHAAVATAAATSAAALNEIAGAWSALLLHSTNVKSDSASSSSDGAWSNDATSVYTDLTKEPSGDLDLLPDLCTASDSSSEGDNEEPSLVVLAAKVPEFSPSEPVPLHEHITSVLAWLEGCVSFVSLEEDDDPASGDIATVAFVVVTATASSLPVDLYDSGASHHMSSYRNDFLTLQEIAPWPLNTANQQLFQGTSMGEMIISVPNDPALSTPIRLTHVLYTPDIRFNLISIGHIDDAGYTVTFTSGRCVIFDKGGTAVGSIMKTHGLYTVAHERDAASTHAAAVADKLTVMSWSFTAGLAILLLMP